MKVNLIYRIKNIHDKEGDLILNPKDVERFLLVEDLEDFFISAHLEVADDGGIFEKVVLTGDEIFEITILQEEDEAIVKTGARDNQTQIPIISEKVLEFEIFDIMSAPGATGRTIKYTFILQEKGGMGLIDRPYSKSYKEKKISAIVKDVCINQLGLTDTEIETEETTELIDFVIPYWKPTTTLKYLRKIATRTKSPQEGGYVFFSSLYGVENITGIKRFISLATLLEQKPNEGVNQKYYLKNSAISPNYVNNILDVNVPSMNNRSVLKNGILGKTFYGLDYKNDKSLITQKQSLNDFKNRGTFLGDFLHFGDNITKDTNHDIKMTGYGSAKQIKSAMDYEFRMSFESIQKRDILCAGTLERWAGQIIDIDETSGIPNEGINTLYSGTWLIKKIVHSFSGDSYDQKITIIKNSFSELPDSIDTASRTTNKNI
jgi:hypothetical protein